MTRAEVEARLLRAGIEEAREEAMQLFCHAAQLSPALALASPDADCEGALLETLLSRRESGEPLAYLLGVAYFCNEEYKVTPAVLIPRADTERLVEEAVARLPRGGRFADLCTGSGCVAISTLAARPDALADAYDISQEALSVARENAAKNRVSERLSLYECDLLRTHGVADRAFFPHAPYDLILANPPYLSGAEMRALDPSVAHEPALALDGGEDGLAFYRHFLAAFSPLLAPSGAFVFEIGWQQAQALSALGEAHGFTVEVKRDLGGRDRVAVLTRK